MTLAEPPTETPTARDTPPVRAARWEIPLAAWFPAVVLAAVFLLPAVGVPFGVLAWPFAPVPLVRLAHRRGAGAAMAGVALCAAFLALVFAPAAGVASGLSAAGVLAAAVGLPVLFAAAVRRGTPPSSAFLGLCLAGGLLFIGLLLGLPLAGEPPVSAGLKAALDANIPPALESYRRSNMDAVTLEGMRKTLFEVRDLVVRFWPGLLGVGWILGGAVAFYTGARAARPAPSALAARFEALRVAPPVAVAFVAAGAGFALGQDFVRTVSGDLLLVLAALYFLAGLSIICHFARKWFRARILRVGLYILAAYVPMCVGVALLGLFDWYVDFRRRGEKEEGTR